MNTLLALASVLTAAAGLLIAYVLQKPYVRAAKMFRQGKVDRKTLKLKNAGAATAICIVLQDHYGHAIDLDLKLDQLAKSVDALVPGAQITITIPDESQPVCLYHENLFGWLFRTELTEVANRFQMVGRKVWRPFSVPREVNRELPEHWWRRHG